MKKRIISFFTALSMTLMLFTGIPISVSAVVGDLASDGYQLDDNGKLTIATDTGMTNWKSVRNTNYKKVTSVEIRSGVTSIVGSAFYECNSLSSITIPDSVTSIGTEAFRSCTSLNNIIIPKSVREMSDKVFNNCTNLTITFRGGPPTWTGDPVMRKASISGSGVIAIYIPCKQMASSFIDEKIIDGSLSDKIQLAHDATHIEAKEATCTAVGNEEYWGCLQCGKKFSNSECTTEINPTIPKTEHGYSTTWSYDGTNHYHECTVCGGQKDTAAHSGGTATCQTQATCSVCKQKYGSLGSHLYISWTKDGNQHWHVCIRCKETDTKVDHTWDDGTVTAATCTTQGTIKYTCTTCEYTKTQYTVTLGHKYDTTWTTNADQHWHACLNSGCTDIGDAANHTFVQKSDGTNHWQECSVCEYKKDETAHSWGNWTLITEPTLNTTGTAERTCDCGEKQTKTDVPSLTDNTVWTITEHVEPTEEAAGKDVYTSDYGEVEVVLSVKEHTHDWGNWSITANPTLTTTGTAERACTKDGTHKDTTELPVLTDKTVWTNDESQHVEPTEEETGKDVYTSEYGNVEVVLPKKEHTHVLVKTDAQAADCTTKGNEAYWTCSGCNKMFLDENGTTEITAIPTIPATGHKFSTEWTSNSTYHWYAATCGHDVVSDKEVHSWDSGIVTTEPTEEAEGVRTYTCTVCSATKTESVPKLTHTHTYSTEWTKDETYHWHAANCGHDVVSDKEVHSWDSGIVTTEPTEEAAGVKTFTCTVCSATRTESVSQIPHTHTYSTEWTSDSTSHWHAATCGHDVTYEAAAHTEDGGTVTVPATTENDGLKTYACSVCGHVMRTVTIPKLGEDHNHSFSLDWKHDSTSHWHECDCGEKNEITPHVEDGGVVTTEPTETSTGIMTYSCETCGYVMRTDVIPALIPEHNHNFGTDWKYDSVSHWHECECGEKSDIANHISSDWIVVTPATTDLEGVQIRKCTVCGIELDRETIEKLPNISTGDVVEDVQDTAGTNAGLVQDNTLIENVLTPDDKTEVTEGHSFEIVLEVTDIRDSVPAADVTAASSALRYNEKIGIYVDLSLFKIKDNSERTPIYNTSGRIGITLTVPDSIYASDRTYSIIRVHDGIAENLGGIYDKASRELTFYTDKFSTYAIAYAASNSGTDRPSVPDTPTNPSVPSVPTYPNTPVVPVTPTVTETTVKKEEEVISDEPYVEDVSSAAGIYESYEADNNIHYVMILIFAAAAGIAVIAAKKHFCKKNMK